MKRLIYLVLLLLGTITKTSGQTTRTVCIDTVEHKTRMIQVSQPYDTSYQICRTETIPSTSVFNGMYVSKADVKVADPVKSTMLLNYCVQDNVKVNFLALYGMGNVWGNSTKEGQINKFIQDAHARGIKVAPVISKISEVMAADAFNRKYLNDFDWMIREKEVWNMAVADQPAGIVTDSLTAVAQKSVSISQALLGYGPYIGWSVQNGRYFKMITVTSSAIFIHVYRTNPLDWNYLKPRLDEIQRDCAALGIANMPIVPITSYEPGFSQNWAKTNPLSKIDDFFKPLIEPYPNLSYWGKLSFTDDYQMISVPYKAPVSARAAAPVMYSDSSFKNVTTLEHRQYLPWIKRVNLLNKKALKQPKIQIEN